MAKLRAENKSYRERWGPVEKVFVGLEDDDAEAIVGFARNVAAGNRTAMVQWLADNAGRVAGDDANLVAELTKYGFTRAEAKAAVKTANQDTDGEAVEGKSVAELVAEAVEAKMAEARTAAGEQRAEAARTARIVDSIDAGLKKVGLTPGSDDAYDVLQEATRLKERGELADEDHESIVKLVQKANRNVLKRSEARVAARQQRQERRPAPSGPGPDGRRTSLSSDERAQIIQDKLENAKRLDGH
jgi:hypothetical protein